MTEQTNLDKRPRVPYSIGTGIPKHGAAEIEGYLQSLRVQGFCVIERVIPEDEVVAAGKKADLRRTTAAARLAFGLAARFDRVRSQRRTTVEALWRGRATLSRRLHGAVDDMVPRPRGCDPV